MSRPCDGRTEQPWEHTAAQLLQLCSLMPFARVAKGCSHKYCTWGDPSEGSSQPLLSLFYAAVGFLLPSPQPACRHAMQTAPCTAQGDAAAHSSAMGGNTAGEGEHGVHGGRNLHGWRGQVQNGIHFSGNSPASSVDRRLNLDIPVWEGGGGEGTAGSAALL